MKPLQKPVNHQINNQKTLQDAAPYNLITTDEKQRDAVERPAPTKIEIWGPAGEDIDYGTSRDNDPDCMKYQVEGSTKKYQADGSTNCWTGICFPNVKDTQSKSCPKHQNPE